MWPLGACPIKPAARMRRRTRSMSAPTGGFDGRGSVDVLGQGRDDPLAPAHRRHAPDAPVLTDAADQGVSVLSEPVDHPLKSVHFERYAAQPQLVGHGVRAIPVHG